MTTSEQTRGGDQPAAPGLLRRHRIPILIYLVCLGGYLAASGGRLAKPSSDNHYVYLAKCFLEGRLSLKGAPPHQNDWALVTELTLRDGRTVRGAFLKTTGGPNRFKTTRGERMVIEPAEIRARKNVYYVSFPWFPALLMLPFVALWGMTFNDVIFNVALGAFNPVLVFFVLRRLSALKLSERSVSEDLWLVAMFAFGTVHFYASVLGQVWYTAHVVGVMLTALYALAALGGRHPVWAGACLALGFVTRTPIPFAVALLVGEVLRRHLAPAPATLSAGPVTQGAPGSPVAPGRAASQPAEATSPFDDERYRYQRPPLLPWVRWLWPRIGWNKTVRDLALAALPVLAVGLAAAVLNYLRFDSPTEFGHSYLNVRWAERIQRWGLFNYHFLSRNLAAMLTLGPKIQPHAPWIQISWHGLSLFLTTPMFLYLLWPRRRSPVQPWLYFAVALPMILHLLYQNSGWVQFGYRFSLDYTVFLVALLAVGGHRIGALARTLIIVGVAVNTFGAVTFGRYWQYYWDGIFPVQ